MTEGSLPLGWRPDVARVLLIDDCPDFRAWARCTLEREGLEVIEARDALAGLQRAVEDRRDCVVVADTLAGLGGLDVASRLVDEPATAGLPVLLSCEFAEAALRRDAKEAGVHALLPRTGRASDLCEPIRAALFCAGLPRSAEGAARGVGSAAA